MMSRGYTLFNSIFLELTVFFVTFFSQKTVSEKEFRKKFSLNMPQNVYLYTFVALSLTILGSTSLPEI